MANCLYAASTGDILEKTEKNYTVFDFSSDWANVITYKRGGWYYRDVGGTKSTFYNVYKNATISSNSGGSGASTLQQGAFFTGSAQKTGDNPGTVSISRTSVVSGFQVTVTASCADQYKAVWWDGSKGGTSKIVTPAANYSYNVSFEQYKWWLDAGTEDSAKGTVEHPAWKAGYYTSTTTKTATPAAKKGYKFAGWYREGESTVFSSDPNADLSLYYNSSSSSYVNTTYKAKFTSTIHTLTVSAQSGGSTGGSASGNYDDGTTPSITATANWDYTFSKWLLTGIAAYVETTQNPYAFTMPSNDVTATATFVVRPSYQISPDITGSAYGSVKLSAVGAADVTLASSPVTGYAGVLYTLTASVTDNILNKFSGWQVGADLFSDTTITFTYTGTSALVIKAVFAPRPAWTIETHVTTGNGLFDGDSDAGMAGCTVAVDDVKDLSAPDRWLERTISVTATPAEGWEVVGWRVDDKDGVGLGYTDLTGLNPLPYYLGYNAVITCHFALIPYTASVVVDSASVTANAGGAEINAGTDPVAVDYGEVLIYEATPEAGYLFAGWFDSVTGAPAPESVVSGIGTSVYTDATYYMNILADVSLTAKFSAPVTVIASHAGDAIADGTGTVQIDDGVEGASATKNVVLGETCTIKTINGADSLFNFWYLTGDAGLTPIEGYESDKVITVIDTTALTAQFVGIADFLPRYIAVLNKNNNTGLLDPLLGILDSSTGEEITEADYIEFRTTSGVTSTGTEPGVPGNKYFKFTGTTASTLSAMANGSLGFMHWTSSRLIPVVDAAYGEDHYTQSDPVILGSLPSFVMVSNSHYVFTAVWGDPVEVPVTVQFAAGSDSTNGGFTMEPITDERTTIGSGKTDLYLQGESITLNAYVANGYKFSGWYLGSTLLSANPTLVYSVVFPVTISAKFIQDSDAVYIWEGGTENKQMEWISKRYVSTKPFNPSAAKVYADLYPNELNIYMCSSPDSPSGSDPIEVYADDQDGFRLPMARPEKYLEIGIKSVADVQAITVSTSMGGLAI